jgi:CcmD family protein
MKMENAGYLFAAFAIVWAVVFGYVLSLFNRQRRLKREINLLKEALKEKGSEQQETGL